MNSLFGPVTENDRWRTDIYILIERQATQLGTTVERLYSRDRESTYTEPGPLQGIQAARSVRARAMPRAGRARGAGHSWDVVGEPLELFPPLSMIHRRLDAATGP